MILARYALTFCAFLLLSACSRPSGQVPPPSLPDQAGDATPVKGDWVVRSLESDPATLNPVTLQDFYGQEIAGHIFESLLQLNNTTLEQEPCLAESYEVSPDKLTFTFHLRHDVKWQDGVPFTADDVLFSYQRIMDPKVDAAWIRSSFDAITTCTELDPWTVRFVAKKIYFKNLNVLGGMPLVPKHLLEKSADFNSDAFARHPIGTGPYRLVRWDSGSLLILERNDDYWGPKIYYPSRLVYQVLTESYVSLQLLKKGELDVVEPVEPTQWERQLAGHSAADRLQKVTFNFPSYGYIGFNLRRPIFSDVRVRHAIDLLIPRDDILAKIYFNQYGKKTSGFFLPDSAAYNHEVAPTPYDPALAQKLLHEAGWSLSPQDGLLHKGDQTFRFTFLYPAGAERSRKVLELTQESLRHNGIDTQLVGIEWAQFENYLNDWNYDACLLGLVLSPDLDPYDIWASELASIHKSPNHLGYRNPEVDKLMLAGRSEYDPAKRNALYRQVHQMIHDDYPACFLFNSRVILVASKRFHHVNIFAPQPCYDVSQWYVPLRLQKYP